MYHQVSSKLVKEQCAVRGLPAEWVADEAVTLQLAVVDKKSKNVLLPSASQEPVQPGSVRGLCVGDVRVRVEEESEQKGEQAAASAEVAVQAVADPRDHQFTIRVKVRQAGEHRLRVWVSDVEVQHSPFILQVKSKHQV
jgi:hypothetical protein